MLTGVSHCSLSAIKSQWVEIYNVPLARDKRLRELSKSVPLVLKTKGKKTIQF